MTLLPTNQPIKPKYLIINPDACELVTWPSLDDLESIHKTSIRSSQAAVPTFVTVELVLALYS